MSSDDGPDINDLLQDLTEQGARYSLGCTADAIDARVQSCLREADELLSLNHPGPALALAATAGELIIRFLLVRPLVHAEFFSEEMASILADRIGTGRSSDDRRLLPDILQRWNIDLGSLTTASGIAVWDFMLSKLWPERDNFIHKGDRPTMESAKAAIECVRCFRETVVLKIAFKLGFTLQATGKWSEIKRDYTHITYEAWDPVSGKKYSV